MALDNFEGEMKLSDIVAAPEDGIKFEDFNELEYILKIFNEKADDRDKEVLYRCIIGTENQYDVAKDLGLSQSFISRLDKRIRQSLIYIAKHGRYKRFSSTPKKKEADKMKAKSFRKYTKYDYIYIFRNYPQLTNRQIAEVMGLTPEGVNPYRTKFRKGLYDELETPFLNPGLLEKIQNYVKDLVFETKETPTASTHVFIDGDKVIEAEPEVSFNVKSPEIQKTPEPIVIPVKKEEINNEELIILNNKISIMSNKEEVSSLIYGIFQVLENLPKDSKVKLDLQLEVIK
jgi:hypothetical protein